VSIPEEVCKQFYDDLPLVALWAKWGAEIHKNQSPFGLRIFLAQRRIFFCRRISLIRLPPSLGSYGGTGRSEILFELSKIFRNALHANF
jgi:hypothetical protein